jgi:hypothetical protein
MNDDQGAQHRVHPDVVVAWQLSIRVEMRIPVQVDEASTAPPRALDGVAITPPLP